MCIDALILKIGRAPHNSENLARYKFGYFFGLSSILKSVKHRINTRSLPSCLISSFYLILAWLGGRGGKVS